MAVRLILVGVVASLGLTLPTGQQCMILKDSAQRWAAVRFADWDARVPSREGPYSLFVDSAPLTPEPTPNPSVRDDSARLMAGSNIPAPPPSVFEADLELDVVAFEAPEAATVIVDDETTAALDALMGDFRHDHRSPVPAVVIVATTLVTAKGEDDLLSTLAASVNAGEAVTFEPIEVRDDLYPGVAFALNRESEGLGLAPSTVVAADLPGTSMIDDLDLKPGDRLTHAVRLTREAVVAWASLIQGPPVVTAAH